MSNLISFEDEKAEERNSLGIVLTIKNVHECTHTYRDIRELFVKKWFSRSKFVSSIKIFLIPYQADLNPMMICTIYHFQGILPYPQSLPQPIFLPTIITLQSQNYQVSDLSTVMHLLGI